MGFWGRVPGAAANGKFDRVCSRVWHKIVGTGAVGRARVNARWLIPVGALALGLVLLVVPYPSWLPAGTNRLTDLGAAVAGGAVIAFTVLLVERGFQAEAERRTLQFQAEAERRALQFQLGLQRTISSVDLRGQNLRESYWMRKTVSESNLSGAEFDGSSLYECRIEDTYLYGARFVRASLIGTTFDGAYLAGASFRGANLTSAEFKVTTVFGRHDRENVSSVTGEKFGKVDFAGADLNNTDFRGADLSNVQGLVSAVNKCKARHDQATRWPGGELPVGFGPPERPA